jgi:glutathione S-transferase
MTDELVFYTNPMSRGRIVRWMLEELGRPYRTELLDYGTTMKAPAYLAINPMGKVPTLRHGDAVVTEGAAICCYLADIFPDAGLAPSPGDRLRGPYYRWLFFAAGPLEAATTNKALGFEVPADRKVMAGYDASQSVKRAGVAANEKVSQLAHDTVESGRRFERSVEDMVREHPIAVGTALFATGAALGLAIPRSSLEDSWVGRERDQILSSAHRFAQGAAKKVESLAKEVAGNGPNSVAHA